MNQVCCDQSRILSPRNTQTVALFPFSGEVADSVPFDANESLEIVEQVDENWCRVKKVAS